MKIVFATCLEQPQLISSDRLAAEALARRGAIVVPAPWDGERAPFEEAALTVIRSTWGYYRKARAFADWLDWLEGKNVVNAPALMRWNMSKSYLLEMAQKGARIPATQRVRADAADIKKAMDALGLEEAVAKPLVSASANGLTLVRRGEPETIANAAAALGGDGLVQQKLDAVAVEGETSFVFLAGRYSHAVVKRPKTGDLRVQAEYGGVTARAAPPQWAVEEAARVLEMIPEPADYARIDAVILDGEFWLMEVEVLEPELFFTYAPEAAERFADVLLNRMK